MILAASWGLVPWAFGVPFSVGGEDLDDGAVGGDVFGAVEDNGVAAFFDELAFGVGLLILVLHGEADDDALAFRRPRAAAMSSVGSSKMGRVRGCFLSLWWSWRWGR